MPIISIRPHKIYRSTALLFVILMLAGCAGSRRIAGTTQRHQLGIAQQLCQQPADTIIISQERISVTGEAARQYPMPSAKPRRQERPRQDRVTVENLPKQIQIVAEAGEHTRTPLPGVAKGRKHKLETIDGGWSIPPWQIIGGLTMALALVAYIIIILAFFFGGAFELFAILMAGILLGSFILLLLDKNGKFSITWFVFATLILGIYTIILLVLVVLFRKLLFKKEEISREEAYTNARKSLTLVTLIFTVLAVAMFSAAFYWAIYGLMIAGGIFGVAAAFLMLINLLLKAMQPDE